MENDENYKGTDRTYTTSDNITITTTEELNDEQRIKYGLLPSTKEGIKDEMLKIIKDPKKYDSIYISNVKCQWDLIKEIEKQQLKDNKKRRNALQEFRKIVDKEHYIPNWKIKIYKANKKLKEKASDLKERINKKQVFQIRYQENESKAKRIISYLFIAGIFLLLVASLAYFIQWIDRWVYNFEYETWTWQTWFLYLSVFFFVATLFLFLSPFIVEQLKVWLNYRINKMIAKTEVYKLKLQSKIEAEMKRYEDIKKDKNESLNTKTPSL